MKGKMREKGIQAMFVGCGDKHAENVYRCVNMRTKKIILNQDVTQLNKIYGDMLYKKMTW